MGNLQGGFCQSLAWTHLFVVAEPSGAENFSPLHFHYKLDSQRVVCLLWGARFWAVDHSELTVKLTIQ